MLVTLKTTKCTIAANTINTDIRLEGNFLRHGCYEDVVFDITLEQLFDIYVPLFIHPQTRTPSLTQQYGYDFFVNVKRDYYYQFQFNYFNIEEFLKNVQCYNKYLEMCESHEAAKWHKHFYEPPKIDEYTIEVYDSTIVKLFNQAGELRGEFFVDDFWVGSTYAEGYDNRFRFCDKRLPQHAKYQLPFWEEGVSISDIAFNAKQAIDPVRHMYNLNGSAGVNKFDCPDCGCELDSKTDVSSLHNGENTCYKCGWHGVVKKSIYKM